MNPLSELTKEELEITYKAWARILTSRKTSAQNIELAKALVRDMKAYLERDIGDNNAREI